MYTERLKLKKLNNTRDLGGMKTADGRTVKRGKLIRSGKLSGLKDGTVKALKEAGVTTIVDLRIPAECSDHPDTEIEGVRYIRVPVLCTPTVGITTEPTMRLTMKKESYRIKQEFGNADNYMIETYRSILFNEEPQEGLKRFLRLVIEEEGCILWHCASGKDRAGICAMLVEALLGVSEEGILRDYVASRRFLRKQYLINKMGLLIVPVSMRFKRILFGFMRTKRKYLQAIIDEMNTRYGGVVGYCKTVLGVTDEDINILRKKYLV